MLAWSGQAAPSIMRGVERISSGAGSGDRPAPCEGNIAANSVGAGSSSTIDYGQIFSGKNVTQKARVLSKPEPEYTVVLGLPPVNSPEDAVKVAIVGYVKQLLRKSQEIADSKNK